MSSTQRVVVITGASSGIGTVTAEHFAGLGDRVIVVGRNPERTQAVADRLGAEALLADYDRLDDVRALAAAIRSRTDHVDVLLNNAGGLVSTRTRTVDGFDSTFQTNHLAPYLLTRLLLPELVAGSATGPDSPEAGRVVSTSSVANRFGRLDLDDLDGFDRPWRGGWRAYGTAKLAVVLFTRELARRQQAADTGVTAYSVHPGAVVTQFGSGSPLIRLGTSLTGGRWGLTPAEGAAPLIALASATPLPAASGTYFDRMRPDGKVAAAGRDDAVAAELWRRSARLVGLPEADPEPAAK